MSDPIMYAIPAFIGLMLLEAGVSTVRRRRTHDARDTAASLAMGVGSLLIDAFWKGVAFAFFLALYQHRLFDLGTGPWVWLLALVADDFTYYWLHRGSHEVRLFWASHVNHHSSQRYNLSTALRQTWTGQISQLVFYWPLPLLGLHPMLFMSAHAINLIYQFWIHTEHIGSLGPVGWVLNTPSHHRVHHGSNPEYLDRNYAGILILWDRLFGTFTPECAPVTYGLTRNIDTYNPIRIAFHEWLAMGRAASRAASWRDALGHLFRHPGWAPDAAGRAASDGARTLRETRDSFCSDVTEASALDLSLAASGLRTTRSVATRR